MERIQIEGPTGRDLLGELMPQSLSSVLVHVVFSTKHRRAWLKSPELKGVMTGYLVGTLQHLNCSSLIVGVVEDHVHLLCNLKRTLSIADLVENLKTSSSSRIKQEDRSVQDFYWQSGYGAFSVSQSSVSKVRKYIKNQEEHHRKLSFQDEFRLLCSKHGVEYDERYMWD